MSELITLVMFGVDIEPDLLVKVETVIARIFDATENITLFH